MADRGSPSRSSDPRTELQNTLSSSPTGQFPDHGSGRGRERGRRRGSSQNRGRGSSSGRRSILTPERSPPDLRRGNPRTGRGGAVQQRGQTKDRDQAHFSEPCSSTGGSAALPAHSSRGDAGDIVVDLRQLRLYDKERYPGGKLLLVNPETKDFSTKGAHEQALKGNSAAQIKPDERKKLQIIKKAAISRCGPLTGEQPMFRPEDASKSAPDKAGKSENCQAVLVLVVEKTSSWLTKECKIPVEKQGNWWCSMHDKFHAKLYVKYKEFEGITCEKEYKISRDICAFALRLTFAYMFHMGVMDEAHADFVTNTCFESLINGTTILDNIDHLRSDNQHLNNISNDDFTAAVRHVLRHQFRQALIDGSLLDGNTVRTCPTDLCTTKDRYTDKCKKVNCETRLITLDQEFIFLPIVEAIASEGLTFDTITLKQMRKYGRKLQETKTTPRKSAWDKGPPKNLFNK